ncbi:UNVERIFIED_CONTAM: hypothetical protein FKN15_025731 [Acipenser sinensis]
MEKACGTLQGRRCLVDPTAQCLSGEEREADSLADESHQGQSCFISSPLAGWLLHHLALAVFKEQREDQHNVRVCASVRQLVHGQQGHLYRGKACDQHGAVQDY